ncbi:MAG: hypothetical protein R3C56_21295 [Pirellulaceae bacterium]
MTRRVADKTVTTLEKTNYTFTSGDFGFSDVDGNSLLAVKIASLPCAGTLYLDTNSDGNVDGGEALTANTTVSLADIDAGRLKFKPTADENGTSYANFTFAVQDDGDTANSGVDTDPTPNTMTINVTSTSQISGHVYEDVNGDSQLGDAVGVAGVTVYLYQDGGDGIANGSDDVIVGTALQASAVCTRSNASTAPISSSSTRGPLHRVLDSMRRSRRPMCGRSKPLV